MSDNELDNYGSIQTTIRAPGGPALHTYVQEPLDDQFPALALVVVHQCTGLGGCAMTAGDISRSCCSRGFLTISFDMRGAGSSSGCSSLGPWPLLSGCAEVHDVVAIAEWVNREYNRRVWLVGVSAGASVAMSALDQSQCIVGFIGIAPVLGILPTVLFGQHTMRLLLSAKPKLIVLGSCDCLTSSACFGLVYALMRSPKAYHIQPCAGHFDIEVGRYGPMHAELISKFVSDGASTNNLKPGFLLHGLCVLGPFCMAVGLVLWILHLRSHDASQW